MPYSINDKEVFKAKSLLGIKEFRGRQEECIKRILEKKDTFGIMPTGTGKSACYQIPGMIFGGITVVVSPLISLIQDQVSSLKEKGIAAEYISAKNFSEVEEKLPKLKFIYVTPEGLRSKENFFARLDISLLAVDEAHCVSAWGTDFRPSYRIIGKFISRLTAMGKRPDAVAAFTATADSDIISETVRMLGLVIEEPEYIRLEAECGEIEDSTPPNISRRITLYSDRRAKNIALAEFIRKHNGKKGIIFCMTKEEIGAAHKFLENEFSYEIKYNSFRIAEYYGGNKSEAALKARESNQLSFKGAPDSGRKRRGALKTRYKDRFKKHIGVRYKDRFKAPPEKRRKNRSGAGGIDVVIATSAFGMGVNIPDIRYVVHYSMPFTLLDYIQQCGRAGRDGRPAECELYLCPEDFDTAFNSIGGKELLMYPREYCSAVRSKSRDKFIRLAEYCVKAAEENAHNDPDAVSKIKADLRKFGKRRFNDSGKDKYVIVSCSEDMKSKIDDGSVSYYESVVADGVYSLWYNGREQFSLRELACIISGNYSPRFTLSEAKRKRLEECVSELVKQDLLPVIKLPAGEKGKDYRFTKEAMSNLPWAFRLHDTACAEKRLFLYKADVLDKMSSLPKADKNSRKKRIEDTETFTELKFYILRELSRMNGSKGRTSYEIIYSRVSHDSRRKEMGLCGGIPDLFTDKSSGEALTGSNRASKERYIHSSVCKIMDNLKEIKKIKDYTVLGADSLKTDGDPRDEGGFIINGRLVRGVRLFFWNKG